MPQTISQQKQFKATFKPKFSLWSNRKWFVKQFILPQFYLDIEVTWNLFFVSNYSIFKNNYLFFIERGIQNMLNIDPTWRDRFLTRIKFQNEIIRVHSRPFAFN